MTVQELIEVLKKMPPDVTVGYYDNENGWTDVEVALTDRKVHSVTGEIVCLTRVDLTGEWQHCYLLVIPYPMTKYIELFAKRVLTFGVLCVKIYLQSSERVS